MIPVNYLKPPHQLCFPAILAFRKDDVLNCLVSNFQFIKECTEKHFEKAPAREHRPGSLGDDRRKENTVTRKKIPQRKIPPSVNVELPDSARCK